MHLTKVTYEEGKELKKQYLCAECSAPLEVAWGGYWGYSGYILRCGMNIEHQGIVKPGRVNKDEQPIYIKYNIEKKEKNKLIEEHGESVGTVVAKYQASTSLTKQQAMEIVQSFWPDAPPIEVTKAAITCNTYGLNPCMRHLFLIPYTNKTTGVTTWAHVLGISATRLMASRRGAVGYKDGPRIMTDDEQLSIRGIIEAGKWWAICTVADKDDLSATGYGCYPTNDASLKGKNKGNTEQNMAFIRAERNALDKKFPGEMPPGLDVVDDTYIESLPEGEIIDGEVVQEEKQEDEKYNTFKEACTGAGYDINFPDDQVLIKQWLEKNCSVQKFSELTSDAQWSAIDLMRLEANAAR